MILPRTQPPFSHWSVLLAAFLSPFALALLAANSVANRAVNPVAIRLRQAGPLASTLCVLGVFAVFSTCLALWNLWATDPLKSIGGFVPVISVLLIVCSWRAMGWPMQGSWWGLAILAATVVLVHVRDVAVIELTLGSAWSIFIPPLSAVAVAYALGAVLLFGGVRLLREVKFPVALMWLVNPVPNFFTLHIDLPLQHASSSVARGFAHLLGQKLTPDQLQLMFTPEFGMFIAPGCNGIRGAITMGLIALVAGYVYRFRPSITALVVAGAVLLGYVFNLVRLCTLVLYYLVALKILWLQPRAAMGDYILGALLFFVATVLLFTLILRLSPAGDLKPPPLVMQSPADPEAPAPRDFQWRFAAMLVLVVVGSISYVRALAVDVRKPATDPQALGSFPQHIGSYTLQRRWNESLLSGPPIFYWAAYRADGPESAVPEVAVGVSAVLGAHDTLICHSARGEDWLWHGTLDAATAGGPTAFSASLYNDGTNEYLEATTLCSGESCGQSAAMHHGFGLSFSRPDTTALLSQSPARPIPVLLRAQVADPAVAPELARTQLTATLRSFLVQARLNEFTRPYRQ